MLRTFFLQYLYPSAAHSGLFLTSDPRLPISAGVQGTKRRRYHDPIQNQQIEWKKGRIYILSNHSEQCWKEHSSYIGRCHLYSHHCLRIFPAKIFRRRLKHIGENCSVSQADAKQSDSRIAAYSRQEKQYNSCQGHSLSSPEQRQKRTYLWHLQEMYHPRLRRYILFHRSL